MNFKPAKKTKTFEILKEIHLAKKDGLTNKELAKRMIGIEDSERRGYRRLSALVSMLEKNGYLQRTDMKDNPLGRDYPVRSLTNHGESFLKFARKGGEISASKSRS